MTVVAELSAGVIYGGKGLVHMRRIEARALAVRISESAGVAVRVTGRGSHRTEEPGWYVQVNLGHGYAVVHSWEQWLQVAEFEALVAASTTVDNLKPGSVAID